MILLNKGLAIVFLLLSTFTSAQARIHVGVGGGGLAEMQVVYLHQNLSQFLLVCVQPNNPCGLMGVEYQEYQSLYLRHKQDARDLTVVFTNQNSQDKVYELRGQQISIGSKYLYNPEGTTWEVKKLLALVVSIRLDLLPSKSSFLINYQRALEIFDSLYQSHQLHRVVGLSRLLMWHIYEIYLDGLKETKIFIEDDFETYDLTHVIQSQLPCGNLRAWRFQNMKSSLGQREVYLMAGASSECSATQHKRGVLVIKLSLDKNTRIIQDSIQVSLRY